jgi:hypothetical protein
MKRSTLKSKDENLALTTGVRVTVSTPNPTGGGAQDPHILLNDWATELDGGSLSDFNASRTFDTYDGQNKATGYDWYALQFPTVHTLNSIEMTMGIPYPDGGWWLSLNVEIDPNENNSWFGVQSLKILPDYRFEDSPDYRLPFQTYALTFDWLTRRFCTIYFPCMY